MLKGIVKKKKYKIAFILVFLMLTLCPQAFEQCKESLLYQATIALPKEAKQILNLS